MSENSPVLVDKLDSFFVPTEISISDLSKLTGKSRETVRNKIKSAGLAHKVGKKNSALYDRIEALNAIYESPGSDKDKEQLLLLKAKREKAELELGILNNQYTKTDEAIDAVSSEYTIVRQRILNWAHNLPLKLLNSEHNRLAYEEVIEAEVLNVLSQLRYDETLDNKPEIEVDEESANSVP